MVEGVSWYPGRAVQVEDFSTLEGYLVSNWTFTPFGASGVGHLDLRTSLGGSHQGASLHLVLRDVQGVTNLGHSVVLSAEESVEGMVELGDNDEVEFHLALGVDPVDIPEKYVLCLSPMELSGGYLYLGKYHFAAGEGLALVRRPLVRHFGALKPESPAWKQWTRPLEEALEQRVMALETLDISTHWRAAAWSAALCDLWSSWKEMPILQLAQRARYLNALAEGDPTRHLTDPGTDDSWLPTDGEALPESVASFLGLRLKPGGLDAPVVPLIAPTPQPKVELKWLAPHTLLARFSVDLEGKQVSLCIPLDCDPPEELHAQGGAAVGGFRVKEVLVGEQREDQMVYPMKAVPRSGETFRIISMDSETADRVYVAW